MSASPTVSTQCRLARNRAGIHRAFLVLNRLLMIPAQRAGLGPWIGSPLGGYMLLLTVRGRRSGALHQVPLSYLMADGSVWVVAGLGPGTQWYRNVLVDPEVDVQLPGRRIRARAVEVGAPEVRARILPRLLRSAGLPALLSGVNPWRATEPEILAALDAVPLVRIDAAAARLEPGPDDPGGTAWVWRQAIVAMTAWLGLAIAGRALR